MCQWCMQVHEGGGEILPQKPHFTRKEQAENWRLGCQVKVKQDIESKYLRKYLDKEMEATVYSNYNVASFIKEFPS